MWASASGEPFTDQRGRTQGGLVVFRDVTEQQNALRKLTLDTLRVAGVDETVRDPAPGMGCTACLQRCARLRDCYDKISRAVEQTADTVVITDSQGVIEYVNPAFEKTTGYARAEALDGTPCILKSGCHDEDFYAQLWTGLGTGKSCRWARTKTSLGLRGRSSFSATISASPPPGLCAACTMR
jgi:hypothetical protein